MSLLREPQIRSNAKTGRRRPKKPGRLTVQIDEMESFGGCKANKQWIWFAIDADSREILEVYVGDRPRQSAKKLWQSLPGVYRQCAGCYTDFWEADQRVIPSQQQMPSATLRERAVGKESRKTNSIERFNNAMRQRVGRLVRKTLSFSQKLSNHIGAVW